MAALARRPVVLLGEQHDNAEHHRWQLQMLAALRAHFRSLTPLLEAERAELTKAREALAAMEEGLPQMLATVSVAPRAVRILPRGELGGRPPLHPNIPRVVRQVVERIRHAFT